MSPAYSGNDIAMMCLPANEGKKIEDAGKLVSTMQHNKPERRKQEGCTQHPLGVVYVLFVFVSLVLLA